MTETKQPEALGARRNAALLRLVGEYPPLPIGEQSGFGHYEVYEAEDMRAYADATCVMRAAQARPQQEADSALCEVIRERDEADDYIDSLLDEVLGADRHEWTSAYGREDALNDVRERMTALHAPSVQRVWEQFEAAVAPLQDAGAFAKALSIRAAQGWNLGGNKVPVLYTDEINGEQVCRDDVWLCTTAALSNQPVPQQEAQEPVMIYHGRSIDCGEHGRHDVEILRMIPTGSKLYTAPQPSPTAPTDALDAARYRWLRAQWGFTLLEGLFGEESGRHPDAELDACIDAEIAEAAKEAA